MYPLAGRFCRDSGVNRISVTRARSAVHFAIAPTASKWDEIGQMPFISTLPIVGFSANNAALPAGCINDPSVSVPSERGLKPAETPTAEPVDDPQGF